MLRFYTHAATIAAVILSSTFYSYIPALAQTQPTNLEKNTNNIDHQKKNHKPTILILTTGGTIAGQASGQGLTYTAGKKNGQDLIAAVPSLQKIAHLKVETVAQIGSQDMSEAVLLKLAQSIEQAEKDPSIQGIVITHGTDTMEETAFFLDNVVSHKKPVILVGALRSPGYTSPDGPANLLEAVKVAADPEAAHRPVMVVMNDAILAAQSVTKTNTTTLQSFQSPNSGQIGIVDESQVRFSRLSANVTDHPRFALPKSAPFPKVDIVYSHVEMGGDAIKDAVNRQAKGIILAGVGDGNTSAKALEALKKAADKGVIVVRSTRIGSGFVNRNVEVNDDQNHFVASEDLNPQKARILLQILLANNINNPAAIQKAFSKLY